MINKISEHMSNLVPMVVESIKALLYRDFGKKHKHQEITDIITQIIQTKTGQKLTNINYDKLKRKKKEEKKEDTIQFEPDFNLD